MEEQIVFEYQDSNDNTVSFTQDFEMGLEKDYNGNEMIPGYIVDCLDGNKYLVFAPDMECISHIGSYYQIMTQVKKEYPDSDYVDERLSIHPAWTNVDVIYEDGYTDKEILHAPASEIGKVYRIL